jgi:hypothetical protein
MFRDLPPHLRMWEPTDEECAAADEQYWHDQAGQMGGSCFDLTDAIGNVLDRRMDEWRADDLGALEKLHRALTDALALAKSVPSVREPPPRPLGSLPLFAAGIANTHNEGE